MVSFFSPFPYYHLLCTLGISLRTDLLEYISFQYMVCMGVAQVATFGHACRILQM